VRRTVRFLARLYPSRWRKRYGVEFDILLEDAPASARHAFDIFSGALKMHLTSWGIGKVTVACAVVGMLAAAAISFAMPVHYLSKALLTVTPADESTPEAANDAMRRSIFNRDILASVIENHQLYARERSHMSLDEAVEKMRRNIQVISLLPSSPENRGTLRFYVQFDNPDRFVAQQVNQDLMSRFIEENLNPQLESHSVFRVLDVPSLPLTPDAPNRTQFAAVGLLAGLLFGLNLSMAVRSRRGTLVS
jgi:capsular polysaccharide biosynthesis protein